MTDAVSAIIELTEVQKRYRGKTVLSVDRLRVMRNDRVLLFGGNASGKSTLLRLLAGIAVPTRGTCRIAPEFGKTRRVLLPQSGGLYEDLTVRQNLLILSNLHDSQPDISPFETLLEDAGDRYLDAPLGTLSGGMQRIVSIASFLSIKPDMLFLDEPFGGLDESHSTRLKALLDDIGRTISLLVVTEHDTTSLEGSWRNISLNEGRIGGDV